MAFKTKAQVAQDKIDAGFIPGREEDYFSPPHGGRAPSDDAVRTATLRYINPPSRTPAAMESGRERGRRLVK